MENVTNNFGSVAPKAATSSNSNLLKKNIEGKIQTTSTPFHDNQNILSSHTGSMHEYFLNGSDINTSHNSPRNAPILGNITNVSSSTINNQNDIISYQRVKKVVYENAESAEALLKQKENMLQHLKSIDLSKYSFPNENKPRTDYTYAKSSSYLKECKELANDNVEMPNLCRRARRSPTSSFHQSPSQSYLNDMSAKSICESKEKLSVYEKLKSFVIPRKNSLQRNLSHDLEDGDLNQPGESTFNRSPGRLVTETSSSVYAGPTFITTKSSVFQTEYTNSSSQPPPATVIIQKTSKRRCGYCLPILLLLLIPFLLYGLNKLDEKENLYENINENYLKRYLDVKINEEKIDLYRQEVNRLSNYVKLIFTNYLPEVFHLVKNKTSVIKDKIIDYKDATIGGFDLAKNFFKSKNEDLAQSLEQIKEKFLGETASSFESSKFVDKDSIRKEFDYIFNYTLNMMSNKLADQLIESKQNYENELKQVKEVLRELDSRYQNLLNQLHEQKRSPEKISEEIVSFQKIEEYINRSFYLYNADKTGMTDFASESVGGSILFTRCTEDYLDDSRWVTVLNVPITRVSISPRVVIQGSMQPGNCWAFKGDKADLFIKLAARIKPSSFSLEHIPKELSLTGVIDSAPQNFTVYGYESKDYINDDVRLLLGNYRYDNESRNTLQFFTVQHLYDKPISVVELKIESNAGNKDFTCLYKFRVHGKLFKQEKKQVDETKKEEKLTESQIRLEDSNRNEF